MPPNSSITSATQVSIELLSVTSRRNNRIAFDLDARSLSFGERMVAATFQPRAAKYSAVALPMPLEAPVIRTVLVEDKLDTPYARQVWGRETPDEKSRYSAKAPKGLSVDLSPPWPGIPAE